MKIVIPAIAPILCLFLTSAISLAEVPRGVNFADMNEWDIVVAEDAIPSERYAAEDFQYFFAQAGGITLPIVYECNRPNRHIFIGESQALRKSSVGFSVNEFGPEDLRIVIRDDLIAIAGGRPRGTLYGVYTFLEDYVGVRFLTADHTHIPPIGEWRVVGPVDRFYHPPLNFRWSYYWETNTNPVSATRLRNNAVTDDPKLGGKTDVTLISHTFCEMLPTAKYGKDHPEYFAEVDGKRLAQVERDVTDTEPCLTNPDVLKIVTREVITQLDANPEQKIVTVSQNDNLLYCRCKKCAAIDEREGGPMGSLLTFVNAVADEVSKKHPDVTVATLSYLYSRKPPKTIKPRPNVQIHLCSFECCIVHPITDPNCPRNVEFCRDLAEWGKICDNISIWNYNTNFSNYLLPCPNLRVIEPNVRYFVANGVKKVFMQGAYTTFGAEMADLRNYIISQLLWDPNRDGQELMNEFLNLHYGRAADPIRQYLNFVHDHVQSAGAHPLCCFGKAKDFAIDETIVQAGFKAFDEAMKLAENDVIRDRVEKASICAYRAAIEPIWIHDENAPMDPALAEKMRPLVAKFFQLCEKHKVTAGEEWVNLKVFKARFKRILGLKAEESL